MLTWDTIIIPDLMTLLTGEPNLCIVNLFLSALPLILARQNESCCTFDSWKWSSNRAWKKSDRERKTHLWPSIESPLLLTSLTSLSPALSRSCRSKSENWLDKKRIVSPLRWYSRDFLIVLISLTFIAVHVNLPDRATHSRLQPAPLGHNVELVVE